MCEKKSLEVYKRKVNKIVGQGVIAETHVSKRKKFGGWKALAWKKKPTSQKKKYGKGGLKRKRKKKGFNKKEKAQKKAMVLKKEKNEEKEKSMNALKKWWAKEWKRVMFVLR